MDAKLSKRRGLRPNGRILLPVIGVALIAVYLLPPCRGDVIAQAGARQTGWLAFISQERNLSRGESLFGESFFYNTPAVIVYRDGRIVWSVSGPKYAAQMTWREGTIDKKRLDRFVAQMQARPFVQKHKVLRDKYSLDWLDDRAQTVGIHIGGEAIIYKPFMRGGTLPEGWHKKYEPSISEVKQAAAAIRALIPRQSHPYVPTAVCVSFVPMEGWSLNPSPKAHTWPVPGERLPTRSFVRTYSGQTMTQVLATLRKSYLMTDGTRKVIALWRPAVEIPIQGDPYATQKFRPDWWKVSKQGAMGHDGLMVYRYNMVADLLRGHLQPGMTPDEVRKLLDKPDTEYIGPSLSEFGTNLPVGTARVWEWQIGRAGGGWSSVDSYYLLVLFNKAGTLTSADLALH